MISRNDTNKIIITTLFIHMILSIFAINNMLYTDVVPCLSSFEDDAVSKVCNENLNIKSKNTYEAPQISSYPEVSSRPICNVDTDDKVVSFSFDDGYNHDNILKILDIFKKNGNLKTTFFFCGHSIDSDNIDSEREKRDHSVKVVYDNGHEIGNHSDSHSNFKKLDKKKSEYEIVQCNEKIRNITGQSPIVFRFPYGSYNQNSLEVIKELNMYPIQWNIDTLDWKKTSTCDSICNKIINNLSSGSIILMHTNGKHTPEALEIVIPKILELGYKIIPVSDLITRKY